MGWEGRFIPPLYRNGRPDPYAARCPVFDAGTPRPDAEARPRLAAPREARTLNGMASAEAAEGEEKKKGPGLGPLLLPLINLLVVLGVMGLIVYTQILHKRPQITETAERQRLAEQKKKPPEIAKPGRLEFPPVTVNLTRPARPADVEPDSGPRPGPEKMNYLNLSFTLELRDERDQARLETARAELLDGILGIVGKKTVAELTSVQGRYLLRTQIMDYANSVALRELKSPDVPITQVYFTNFVAQ